MHAAHASRTSDSFVLLYPSADNPYLQQVKLRLQKKKNLQVLEAASADDVLSRVEDGGTGLLFVSVRNFKEFKEVLKCLARLKGAIQGSLLRVLGVTDMSDPRVIKVLKGRGCRDVFPTQLLWSSVKSNISHAMDVMRTQKIMGSVGPLPDRVETIPAEHPVDWEEPQAFDSNLDSKLKIWIGPSDPVDNRLIEAHLIEMSADSVTIEVDTDFFKEGDEVVLVLDDPPIGSKSKITVKLDAVIPLESDHQMAFVKRHEVLAKLLEPTQKVRAQLQTKIFDFLKQARGW